MKTLKLYLVLLITTLTSEFLFAQCNPPTAQADLDIANVRARIMNGGDMWWDAVAQLGPKYEVPINSGQHVLFAGGIWIGGFDASGNLKGAAQTYRQNGSDFLPGPADTSSPGYDNVWKITRQEVLDFISGSPPTNAIINWPGNGDGLQQLAPYHDINGDGVYNYADGDYPDFGFTGSGNCCDILHGDQSIWWVINDVCYPHTESGCLPFGIEIQCEAFAFSTTDADINNTTFYQFKLVNKTILPINNFYFGFFSDPDLGNYADDYVGCDVGRSMAYCYNDSAAASGFYQHPPAIGIDFLKTPFYANGARMSNFVSFDNNFSCSGNPITCQNYYGYLKSLDCNGNPYTHLGVPANYMFPYNSDPTGIGTGGIPQPPWTEITENNMSGDRRMVQSAGPFTINPGAYRCISMAVIWARDTTDPGPYYSLSALQLADDKIQLFFDSCYHYGSLGIEEQENIYATVYPNPVSDVLEINFGKNISDGKFILYDIFG
ncbi:MAG TPA: hypothetical protein VI757_12200, partial [Bacteroidia bacterium]|nr:hypothetical protein [Bacteroidia bacterium]